MARFKKKGESSEPTPRYETKITKCTLESVLNNNEHKNNLSNLITKTVCDITKINKLATLNCHQTLYNLVKKGSDDELRNMFLIDGYPDFRNYFYSCQKSRKENANYNLSPEFRNDMIVNNVNIPVVTGVGQLIKFLYQDFGDRFRSNINKYKYSRVLRFFKCVVSNHYIAENKELIDDTMKYLFDPQSTVMPSQRFLDIYLRTIKPLLPVVAANVQNAHEIPRGWFYDHKKWFCHVPEMIRIQWHIRAYNRKIQQNYFKNKDKKVKKQKRQRPIHNFTVVPQSTLQRRHVTIDSEALMGLANTFLRRDSKIVARLQNGNEAQKRINWSRFFDFSTVMKNISQFGLSISTNAVDVSVTKKKQIQAATSKSSNKKNNDNQNIESIQRKYQQHEYNRIVGIDTGFKLMAACVGMDLDDNTETNYKYSSKNFHKSTG